MLDRPVSASYFHRVSTELTPATLKKTPLYDEHVKAAARIVDFGGWAMPVQYSGIVDEHQTVRNAVGIFDISHMGEVFVSGPGAKAWLNELLANNLDRIQPGQCQYTFMLNERGGVIDDLIVYQFGPDDYFLVINASKIDEDVAWMQRHLRPGVVLEDKSAEYAGIAVQGPRAGRVFDLFVEKQCPRLVRNGVARIEVGAIPIIAVSTGYTGEDGFELFFPGEHAAHLWNELLRVGAPFGIKPCGLGARDTLRLEMCYPLNGNDLSADRTPLEAGLGFFVDLEKAGFIGRERLLSQRQEGCAQRLVAFRMTEKSPPPRAHYAIYKNGEQISELTSGSLAPSLGTGIGMAYLPTGLARVGEEIEVDIRGRRFRAVIEKKPLYRKSPGTAAETA